MTVAAMSVAWWLCLGPQWVEADEDARPALSAEGPRAVVQAIVRTAEGNALLPRKGEGRAPFRAEADELTEIYVRAAAAAANRLPADQARSAFLIGLGVGLDDSSVLRNNPVCGKLVRQIESDAERQARLRVLGSPTVHRRRDLAQHFVVSCALAAIVGPTLAESIGLYKERRDSEGGSGFSFADHAANLSGITLAEKLKSAPETLGQLVKDFRVTKFVAPIKDLPEGLTPRQMVERYDGEKFQEEIKKIRLLIADLPAYRPSR